jgi:hypothetical protein
MPSIRKDINIGKKFRIIFWLYKRCNKITNFCITINISNLYKTFVLIER